jgi:formylglycine-generating enzyme required for sulfatase activity
MNVRYPQPHVYDKLRAAGKRLARVPRYGRLLANLPPDELARCTTEAYTYWTAYRFVAPDPTDVTGLLDDGLKATEAKRLGWHRLEDVDEQRKDLHFRRKQVRLACDLLGALAFKMFCGVAGDRKPAYVIRTNVEEFLDDVFAYFTSVGAYYLDRSTNQIDPSLIRSDWHRLKAMDSHGLKHVIFSANKEEIRWTDITTMAFFAAYWACRWATGDDRQAMRNWVIDPLTETNDAYREFWTFAVEMPDEAIDRERWIALFAPFYDGSLRDANDLSIRSTEFIYRSWERMDHWTAAPRRQFLAEFPAIRAGQKGAAKRTIAEEMLAGFIPLVGSGKPGDTGTFLMGAPADEDPDRDSWAGKQDNPQHKVTLSSYRLHRFCVTNLEYELFDSRHKGHRWWGGEQHPSVKESGNLTADDVCPVVMVSWYDAWCFARWTGNHLPTEAQWEYGCRGGAPSYQTFHFGDSLSSTQANFNGNYPYGKADKGKYLERTTRVGSYQPNGFGLYDMHGNVWEWCADWYAAGFYETEKAERQDPLNDDRASARVLRGGSWLSGGGRCRSANRYGGAPDYRDQYDGFRLAAVPCVVGAQSGKPGGGAEAPEPDGVESERAERAATERSRLRGRSGAGGPGVAPPRAERARKDDSASYAQTILLLEQ